MTKLLEEGIKAIRDLPKERQDVAGEVLLTIAAGGARNYRLTAEQIEGIKEAQAQVARGEYASEELVKALFGSRFV